MNWRERWLAATAHRPHPTDDERPGLHEPVRMDIGRWLLAIARIEPARVRRVPAAAIVEEGSDEVGEFSMVECPCGAKLIVRSRLERCLGCQRYYVEIERGAVWVTYGEMSPPPLAPVHYGHDADAVRPGDAPLSPG